MKVLMGVLGVLVLLSAVTPVMADSTVHNDGYRQGSRDYIHKHFGFWVDNPTNNPNITEFVNGYNQAWNDVQSGPYGAPGLHFSKKAMDYADGWFDGVNALAYNLTASPIGHNSNSYVQGWYNGRYPTN